MKARIKLPHRRSALKALHWSMVPLLIWFVLVTPDDVLPFGQTAFRFHSILGLIFVTACLLWTADYLRRGLASRPGPKLPPWARPHGAAAVSRGRLLPGGPVAAPAPRP